MLHYKNTLFVILAIPVFLVSCHHFSLPFQDLRKQQFERGKLERMYALCVFPIYKTEWDDDKGYQNDTILCCCPIDLLYEEMNVYVLDIDEFIEKTYKQLKSGFPIKVSPYLYTQLYPYKIDEDIRLNTIYEQTGMTGILTTLATKELYDWYQDFERFKFIVYLCWQNNVYFYMLMADEVCEFKWYVSGDSHWVDSYYSLAVFEDWHN